MRTKKVQAVFSSADELELKVPKAYNELTQEQLRYVYFLMTRNVWPVITIQFKCFCRFAGLSPIRDKSNDDFVHLYVGGRKVAMKLSVLANAAKQTMAFITEPSPVPVRLESIGGHAAIDALFLDLPFGDFLLLENYYQGYILSQETECLQKMAAILYPGIKQPVNEIELFNVTMWFMSVKLYFARKWRHLFAKGGDDDFDDDELDPEKNMNDMLRALTGGHPERETAIKQVTTWQALRELDYKAQDYAKTTHR